MEKIMRPESAQALFQALGQSLLEEVYADLLEGRLQILVPLSVLRDLKMLLDAAFEEAHKDYEVAKRQVLVVTEFLEED